MGGSTKFNVKHQGKYTIIYNLQSINNLWVTFLSRPFALPFPWASQQLSWFGHCPLISYSIPFIRISCLIILRSYHKRCFPAVWTWKAINDQKRGNNFIIQHQAIFSLSSPCIILESMPASGSGEADELVLDEPRPQVLEALVQEAEQA